MINLFYQSGQDEFAIYTLFANGVSVTGLNKERGRYKRDGLSPKEFVREYVKKQEVADKIFRNLGVMPV